MGLRLISLRSWCSESHGWEGLNGEQVTVEGAVMY